MGAELFVMHHSTCARKALFVVLEKDLLARGLVSREVSREHLRTPEYRAIHPDGLVPALVVDGTAIVESSVIMRWLDEAYPDTSLTPESALSRARMALWMKRVDERYFPALQAMTVACFMKKMFEGNEAGLQAMLESLTDHTLRTMREDAIRNGLGSRWVTEGLGQLRLMLDRMEEALAGGTWLVGERMTLADCAVVPLVLRLEEFQLSDSWSGRPRVAAWWARVKSRETVQRLVALADQALLAELTSSVDPVRAEYLQRLV